MYSTKEYISSSKKYGVRDPAETDYDYAAEDESQQPPQSSSPTFRAWGAKAPSAAAAHSSASADSEGDIEVGKAMPPKDLTNFRPWGSKSSTGPVGDVHVPAHVPAPAPAPASVHAPAHVSAPAHAPEGRFRIQNTRDFHQSEDSDSDTFNVLHGH